MNCVVCKAKGRQSVDLFALPNCLRDIGVQGTWAHPACVTERRKQLVREGKKKGRTLAELVESQQGS